MAQLKVLGTAAVITSSVKLAQLKQLEKFKPNALKLVEETKPGAATTKFIVKTGDMSSVNQYGIVFSNESVNGFATATIGIPSYIKPEDKADYATDTFGYAMLNLNELEAQIVEATDELAADFNAMSNSITVE